MRLILFLLFIVVPALEIATFIQIGSLVGLWPTLAGIVVTAVVGAMLVRHQGLKVLNEAREAMAASRPPLEAILHGVFILLAGVLLMTPGYVTDAIGFLFLVPPLRLALAGRVWRWVRSRVDVSVVEPGRPRDDRPYRSPAGGMTIEGEATEIEDAPARGDGRSADSPWRDGPGKTR